MSRSAPRQGFTLIELLIVISVIAVLMGFSFPALQGARRAAERARDLANLKSHATAVASYGATNKGVLPNVNRGNQTTIGTSGTGTTGPNSRPAHSFASADDGGSEGLAIVKGIQTPFLYQGYPSAFGSFIAGGTDRGMAMLNSPVFARGQAKNRRAGVIEDIKKTGNSEQDYLLDIGNYNAAILPVTNPLSGLPEEFLDFRSDYTYTMVAYMDRDGDGFKLFEGGGGESAQQANPFSSQILSFRAYVQSAAFRFPSQKVIFWADDLVQTLDGSASRVGTQDYAKNTYIQYGNLGARWGDSPVDYSGAAYIPERGRSRVPNGEQVLPFLATYGGVKGRDIDRKRVRQ